MHVDVDNRQTDLTIALNQVSPLVQAVLAAEKVVCDEVSIHFVSEEEISDLHQQFFNDPKPTDCISFPLEANSSYRLLGDVFVCPKVAINYASKHGLDSYQELTLYVIHGLLHLVGYDDIKSEDRKKMRAAERRLMKKMNDLNLWLA
jgi:probable rRNA maturation factor